MAMHSSGLRPQTVAEASAWFAEFRADEVTSSTRTRFDEWLRQSPEHIQAYLEVAAGWSELPTADPEGRIDIRALIMRARESDDERIVLLSHVTEVESETRHRSGMPLLAASLVLMTFLIGTGAWIWIDRLGMYSTAVGEQRTLSLADGSTVILNAMTTVRVRYNTTIREVDLIGGQAFFHDTQDRKRPFIVRSDGATVRAIGTQFDVYGKKGETVITVVEGRVAVANDAVGRSPFGARGQAPGGQVLPPRSLAPVLVSAGQQVIVSAWQVAKPKAADVTAATAWVEKRLVFDNTPLADVAAQFNIYSSRRLVIAEPSLQSVGVSGVYSSADPESLIGFLRAQPGLVVTETPKEITVTRREQK